MPSPWVWDGRRYHDDRGRFIGQEQMLALRDRFVNAQSDRATDLSQRLAQGDITAQRWYTEMRRLISETFGAEYMLGRGGLNAMTPEDGVALGKMVRRQYEFLNEFALDVAAGGLTPGRIAARARMYMDAGTQAFEAGKARAAGIPSLPSYPSNGDTPCRSQCKCRWEIEEDAQEWRAYWRLGDAEHCAGCVENAARWAPYRVAKRAA